MPIGHYPRKTAVDRFWAKVEKRATDQCWPWKGYLDRYGYGPFKSPIRETAHRFSYRLHKGEIPESLIVRHSCDNPRCVNPAHLLIGTFADNSRDMVERNRSAKGDRHAARLYPERVIRGDRHPMHLNPLLAVHGSKHPSAKLTERDIPFIRHWLKLGHCLEHIAQVFGVYDTTILKIRKGKTWKQIPTPAN